MVERPCLIRQGLSIWHKQFRRQYLPSPQESGISPKVDVELTVNMAA